MNINEVLATRATQLLAAAHSDLTVHPNDHVNASQSTNDTYPTAMAITLLDRAAPALAALAHLREAFLSKAAEYDKQPRLGRTCLQDAVPLTVGQHTVRRPPGSSEPTRSCTPPPRHCTRSR